MSSSSCESDDAPEEYTSQQGLEQQIEINRAQQQSIAEARLQLKERRKKWAQRLTPKSKPLPSPWPSDSDIVLDQHNNNHSKHSQFITGMLPDDIVTFLAQQNNQVFLSDSDEDNKPKTKKKKKKPNVLPSGIQTVILKELPPTHCVNNSLEFLNKRKMQVPRSSAVLNNSNQALRLLSSSGLLK